MTEGQINRSFQDRLLAFDGVIVVADWGGVAKDRLDDLGFEISGEGGFFYIF
jgi:hypothetical protein